MSRHRWSLPSSRDCSRPGADTAHSRPARRGDGPDPVQYHIKVHSYYIRLIGAIPLNALSDLASRDYPDRPGVYIWKDAWRHPIYVGKARNLANRLRTYFAGGKDIKTRFLLERAADLELIVTATEYEALLLENNLIKQWRPKYNITLKDGKTYPVIRITAEDFPGCSAPGALSSTARSTSGPIPSPSRSTRTCD